MLFGWLRLSFKLDTQQGLNGIDQPSVIGHIIQGAAIFFVYVVFALQQVDEHLHPVFIKNYPQADNSD
jgi:hypothetical protein